MCVWQKVKLGQPTLKYKIYTWIHLLNKGWNWYAKEWTLFAKGWNRLVIGWNCLAKRVIFFAKERNWIANTINIQRAKDTFFKYSSERLIKCNCNNMCEFYCFVIDWIMQQLISNNKFISLSSPFILILFYWKFYNPTTKWNTVGLVLMTRCENNDSNLHTQLILCINKL